MIVDDGPARTRPARGGRSREAKPGPLRADAFHMLAYLVTDDSALQPGRGGTRARSAGGRELLAEIAISASIFAVMSGGMPTGAGSRRGRRAACGGARATRSCSPRRSSIDRVPPPSTPAAASSASSSCARTRSSARRVVVGRDDTAARDPRACSSTWSASSPRRASCSSASATGPVRAATSTTRASRCCCSPSWRCAPGGGSSRRSTPGETLELSLGADMWNAEAAGHWTCALVDAHLGRVESARAAGRDGPPARRSSSAISPSRPGARTSSGSSRSRSATRRPRSGTWLRSSATRSSSGWSSRRCSASLPTSPRRWCSAGDLDGARDVQAELEARGRELGRTWAVATALRCRGLIAAVGGQPGRRVGGPPGGGRAARRGPAAVRSRADAARARDGAAAGEAAGGRRASSLEAALAVFEELGAALWADRARAEIARLGGRRAKDRDELTETERRIAELAADGRSNREIAGELFVVRAHRRGQPHPRLPQARGALAHGARAPAADRLATPRSRRALRARALRPSAAGRPEPWPARVRPRRRARAGARAGRRAARAAARGCAPTASRRRCPCRRGRIPVSAR